MAGRSPGEKPRQDIFQQRNGSIRSLTGYATATVAVRYLRNRRVVNASSHQPIPWRGINEQVRYAVAGRQLVKALLWLYWGEACSVRTHPLLRRSHTVIRLANSPR